MNTIFHIVFFGGQHIKAKLLTPYFYTAWNDLLDVWAWKPGVQTRNEFHAFLYPNLTNMATHEAPHIGHLIKLELARQERTVAWLARKLHCSRQNVYHLFESQWVSTEILSRLCDILDCNFFKVYSDYWENKKVENGF